MSIVVQSKAAGSPFPSDEPFYGEIVPQQVGLAAQHAGVKIDLVGLTILNPSGDKIYESIMPLPVVLTTGQFQLDNASATKLIQAQLPTDGLSVAALSVRTNSDGLRIVDLTLKAQDIPAANTALGELLIEMRESLKRLNDTQNDTVATIPELAVLTQKLARKRPGIFGDFAFPGTLATVSTKRSNWSLHSDGDRRQ